MADFSKQYCEQYDPELPHDFDILEIAEGLEKETYLSIICEGFGFVAVGKDFTGKIILAMPIDPSHQEEGLPVVWKSYDEVVFSKEK